MTHDSPDTPETPGTTDTPEATGTPETAEGATSPPHSLAGSAVPAQAAAGTTAGATTRAHLTTQALRAGYGRRVVVHDVDVNVPSGRITVIIGANACGKSTLLKTMARVLAPMSGRVLLDGRSISTIPTRRLATRLGLLPQQPIAPEGITVADLVGRGRHPHQPAFSLRLSPTSATDRRVVEESLLATRTAELADRSIDELSGGQRQRVWIAMALAQRTDVLLLDEPTTFLDLAHQVEVLDLLTDLNRERGTTVVMVLHDVNLAARYADHVIAMKEGRVVAAGEPDTIIDAALVREVLGLQAEVITDPVSGTPLVLPRGRHHVRGYGAVRGTSGQDTDTEPAEPASPAGQTGALRTGVPAADSPGENRSAGGRT
nr:ABC transporter ATP-binding protein [Actinomyces wuliandei]